MSGTDLYVGGNFDLAGGALANCVASYTPGTITATANAQLAAQVVAYPNPAP
jgi:hypothetical protein